MTLTAAEYATWTAAAAARQLSPEQRAADRAAWIAKEAARLEAMRAWYASADQDGERYDEAPVER